jgi:hypothetical protein
MRRPARRASALASMTLASMTLAVVALAGCGSQHGERPGGMASTAPPPSLALALASAADTWATVQMGGSAAQYDNFWQLFVRPAGATSWRLVTPPGMASNGGLLLASTGGKSLVTGFRPSQQITFSPLTSTADGGAHWATGNVVAGLADVPDALAAAPGSGDLIALLPNAVELSRPGGSGWTTLARTRSVTDSAAGRACGLSGLTAVAFSPAGALMAAGACAKAGTAGIFAFVGGRWQAAGPALPASLAGQPVTVLRLTTVGDRQLALLSAGSGSAATVVAVWSAGGAGHWDLSRGLRTQGRQVLSTSFGPGGAVGLVLSGGRGEMLAGPGGGWRQLPALPSGTQVLAMGVSGQAEALASHGSVLTVWGAGPASAGWVKEQAINVPIQYGSSS